MHWRGRAQVVLDIPSLDRVVVRDVESGVTDTAPIVELSPPPSPTNTSVRQDLMLIPEADWTEAWRRYELIRPLLEMASTRVRMESDVAAVAAQAGRSPATIYRWVSRYEETGLLTALLRPGRSDRGASRLSTEQEAIITEVIKTFYLSTQQHSIAETCLEIERRCRVATIASPHRNTVRSRIAELSDKLRMTKRMGYKAARARFEPIKGSFPNADVPLAVVQIDHTPVDLTLVDDIHRLPIGRPYLTLAIDVFSRMIAGFYITLESPGALSAGLCIANAILPKENFLAQQEIATHWPVWGKMGKIYVDNAKEFRGGMLERACAEHTIILEHRPKGIPNYGGHVERAFRTFMSKTHGIAGTTFSNTKQKGEYDTDANASMTLSEFERWFTIFVVEVYHQRGHKGISDIPPIKLYEESLLGTDERPGIGLPARVKDEWKLRLDFMPFLERTIQEYGVVIDNIHYYSDVLRRWIHSTDPKSPKLKQKFIFARDPRDISTVYFLDPELKTYMSVPYRDTRHPAVSIWELRASLERLAKENIAQPNEELIFEGIRKMREIELEAVEKTKKARKARRTVQRRHGWQNKSISSPIPVDRDGEIDSPMIDGYPDTVVAFLDIEEAE